MMDNSLMEKIFSNDFSLENLPLMQEEISKVDRERIDYVFDKMSTISAKEADLLYLYLIKGIPQSVLGKIFGYTQPNIHYRLERGMGRLKVIVNLPVYDLDELENRLRGFFTCDKDIRVMVLIYVYSSQSKVAEIVGESQGKVRYRFLKCLKSLSNSQSLNDIYLMYKMLKENLTLLRKSKDKERVKAIL